MRRYLMRIEVTSQGETELSHMLLMFHVMECHPLIRLTLGVSSHLVVTYLVTIFAMPTHDISDQYH